MRFAYADPHRNCAMMLPSRHYESEHTKFMRELLRQQPDLVRKQRNAEGR